MKNGIYIGLGYFIGTNLVSYLLFQEVRWQALVSGVIGVVVILILSVTFKNKNQ
ncbi:hypothetical protein [Halalkalibacter wakoensis]|uniref:hypothetical protein n=1 Tax=Halalkalibacter wakoensis TaxID=127891 RepID=UPI000AB00A46|nr:hypothetical protein [Halalkalibacter wakoensis]